MSLLMYDVHNNFAPDNIKNMFTKLSSVQNYRTRSVSNENYYVEQVRTVNMKRAFSISGALMRNSIPLSIKHLKKNQFKSELKRNSLKYWKKRTTILEFLILQGHSQNRNMVYFCMKYSLPSCLTLAINHTTN